MKLCSPPEKEPIYLQSVNRYLNSEMCVFSTMNLTFKAYWLRDAPTILTHCVGVTQICVFNTVKLGTSASSP